METYTTTITLTRSQMREIGHEYDILCRMEDVQYELDTQLKDCEKEGDPDILIIGGEEVEYKEFIKKFDIKELATDFEHEYDWDTNGPTLLQNMVSDAIDEAVKKTLEERKNTNTKPTTPEQPTTTEPSFEEMKRFAENAMIRFLEDGGLIPELAEQYTKEWIAKTKERRE